MTTMRRQKTPYNKVYSALWLMISMSLMIVSCVNDVTITKQSTRVYPPKAVSSEIALYEYGNLPAIGFDTIAYISIRNRLFRYDSVLRKIANLKGTTDSLVAESKKLGADALINVRYDFSIGNKQYWSVSGVAVKYK